MHLIFATQGIKTSVDAMINDLQAQYWEWPCIDNETGKLAVDSIGQPMVVQGGLRPVQLWMYVFPKESLHQVMNTMGIEGQTPGSAYTGFMSKADMLRKLMKADKLPEADKSLGGRIIRKSGVGIVPIGIKVDPEGDIPTKNWTGERL